MSCRTHKRGGDGDGAGMYPTPPLTHAAPYRSCLCSHVAPGPARADMAVRSEGAGLCVCKHACACAMHLAGMAGSGMPQLPQGLQGMNGMVGALSKCACLCGQSRQRAFQGQPADLMPWAVAPPLCFAHGRLLHRTAAASVMACLPTGFLRKCVHRPCESCLPAPRFCVDGMQHAAR